MNILNILLIIALAAYVLYLTYSFFSKEHNTLIIVILLTCIIIPFIVGAVILDRFANVEYTFESPETVYISPISEKINLWCIHSDPYYYCLSEDSSLIALSDKYDDVYVSVSDMNERPHIDLYRGSKTYLGESSTCMKYVLYLPSDGLTEASVGGTR